MPRASKTVNAIQGHRTKAELELRKAAEENLKTGIKISERTETKSDKTAHSEFLRISKLFNKLDKNDGLYTAVINRYCLLRSECLRFENLRNEYNKAVLELTEDKESIVEDYATEPGKETISLAQYYKMKNNFSKTILSLDASIMSKRKMMFDIEKENLMTVQAGLRSIPKTPSEQTENPLLKALSDDD